MLLLIKSFLFTSKIFHGFNTSHVTINHFLILLLPVDLVCFNTSHVTINRNLIFRYLLSCFVSIHLMLLLIKYHLNFFFPFCRFNTSHVTINQPTKSKIQSQREVSIHLMLLLIPQPQFGTGEYSSSFNTSHVTINQKHKCRRKKLIICFNTSHVTINQWS